MDANTAKLKKEKKNANIIHVALKKIDMHHFVTNLHLHQKKLRKIKRYQLNLKLL
jgi:hypothetical protein